MSDTGLELGSIGDVLPAILFKTFENQCTYYKPFISISTRKPRDEDEENIKTVESLPGNSKRQLSRFLDQNRQFSTWDKEQRKKRKTLKDKVESMDGSIYNYLLEKRPDTLADVYSKTNPETGEEEKYQILMKQHKQKGKLGKGDVRHLNKQAFEETMAQLYPKIHLDRPFDDEDLAILETPTFVAMFHDKLVQKILRHQEENQSFVTKVDVLKADRHSYE